MTLVLMVSRGNKNHVLLCFGINNWNCDGLCLMNLPQDIIDQDEFMTHRYEFFLLPRLWSEYKVKRQFSWDVVKFRTANRSTIPKESGLYTFLLQPSIACHPSCSNLMYVGKSKDLCVRYAKYLTTEQHPSGRPKLRRFLYLYKGYIWFCYCKVPRKFLDEYEDALIEAYVPPLNSDLPATIRSARGAF